MAYLKRKMGYLTEEMKARALDELGETEEVRVKSIIKLRNLVTGVENLLCKTDDDVMLLFLRPKKFCVQRSFNTLTTFFRMKIEYKDIYGKLDFEGLLESMADGAVNVLPYRDEEGSAIVIMNFGNFNFEKRSFASYLHDIAMNILYCAMDPACQVCGIKMIVNLKDFALSDLKHVKFWHLYGIGKGIKNAMPLRFRGFHIITDNPVLKHTWSLISYVMSEKLRKRVFFHSTDMKTLGRHIPTGILPQEYGGRGYFEREQHIEDMKTHEKLYFDWMSYGYRT